MDYECMKNLFIGAFVDYNNGDKIHFVIHPLINQVALFIEFLETNIKNKDYHLSFNGINYDSQMTEFILENKELFLKLSGKDITDMLYNFSQKVIKSDFPEFPDWTLKIKQMDVFKVNHWDNKNKSVSLKWAQGALDWYNLQEMPIHHSQEVTSLEDIKSIIDYCYNDILSTKELFKISKPLYDIRNLLKNKYKVDWYNFSNSKMGSELLLKLYCEQTSKSKYEVRKQRTFRTSVNFKDIIFDYVKFKSKEFNSVLDSFREIVITEENKKFAHNIKYKGYDFFYGLGGIHQSVRGIFRSDDKRIIKDIDVASLYPSIACQNEMYPAHLGPEFFRVYKHDVVDVRLAEKSKKEGKDMAIIEGYKEASNSCYGKSNEMSSWMYDPQYTYTTTVNGQLMISMLAEELLSIPGTQLLQTNTDGLTLMIDRCNEDEFNQKCRDWEAVTKLTLEYAEYKEMFIFDVNNYLVLKPDGKTKCKGRFEWEELQNHKYTHIHKDKSALIVPKAVFNFFVNKIIPEVYIKENRNIFDYCLIDRVKAGWKLEQLCSFNGDVTYTPLQRTIRYYVSKKGCKILKKSSDKTIQLVAGKWLMTMFNLYEKKDWNDYGVNDDYYLDKIYQEIELLIPSVTNEQLTLTL